MAPYSSAQRAGATGKLRLDFNENTVGLFARGDRISARASDGAAAFDLSRIRRRDARAGGVLRGFGEDEFTLTNGTDEAIQVLMNTFVDDGDEVLLLKPSYAMYRFYAEVAGASVREVEYRAETLAFPLEELLAAITPETRAVLIANPNNPTGTAIDLDGVRKDSRSRAARGGADR